MKLSASLLRASAAALAFALPLAAPLAAQDAAAPAAEAAPQYPLTPQGAKDWLAAIEPEYAAFVVEYGHISWLNAT
jgi:peptidyl-dipeptidase A